MSSSSAPRPGQRASRQLEPEDSYPHIPEPKQAHVGNFLAILSVIAVLAFGTWTAFGTYIGTADKPAVKAQALPTAAPTSAAAAIAAPTATPAATPAPTSAPGAARTATTGPGGTRVHVVGAGDSLYRMALLYGTTVEAIMAANGFTDRSKVLHVGDKLNIP